MQALQVEGETARLQQLVASQHQELQRLRDLVQDGRQPQATRTLPLAMSLTEQWASPLRQRFSPLLPVHHDLFSL